jgi:hypothetical protein
LKEEYSKSKKDLENQKFNSPRSYAEDLNNGVISKSEKHQNELIDKIGSIKARK